jgi:hypothetical protein
MASSRTWIVLALTLAAGTAVGDDGARIAPFSAGQAGSSPAGWEVMRINPSKKLTQYRLVPDSGTVVLHASSDKSASGLGQYLSVDLEKTPVVEWRWKVSGLIEDANPAAARAEDSPARLVFAFEGDYSKLPVKERATAAVAKKLSGNELPYATLMYIWANELPADTIVNNPHTGRVRMIVVASGAAGVGKWQSYSRNLREDYKRAFGEYPARMLSYGVLTDTDNTGERVEAWYGDIVFKPAR